MDDTTLILLIVALGSIGILVLFLGLAHVSALLKKHARADKRRSDQRD